MREYYELALMRRPPNDYYPRLNLVVAQIVSSWLAGTGESKRSPKRSQQLLLTELDAIAGRIEVLLKDGPDFLADQARIDCRLLNCIAADTLTEAVLDDLAGEYADIRALSSLREFASIRDQIDFLCHMAVTGKQGSVARALGQLIKRLA